MAGTIPDELLLSRIRKEAAAREAAIAALQAALDAATAETQERIIAAASRLTAQINNRTVSASAIAGIILRTQVEEGFAMAEQVTALEAKVNDLENTSAASIIEVRSVIATQYESFAQQTLTLRAVFNDSIATVTDQITVVSNATSALATRTTSLEATVNNPTTGVAASYAKILAEETARATADSALATRATSLEATVFSATDGNVALKARIATEETARASADTALSTSISTVSATISGKNQTFFQMSTPTAVAIGDLWIDTNSGANSVKRWDGSSWVDTQVASGAIGAAVATESSARATADGNLSGKYSLKVIAGNVVTGMNITSSTGGGTDVSDITFQASSFKVYNGSTGVAPFQVVGGQVKVTGSLVISSGDVSGLGSLATASSVDLTTQVTNKSLANLDGTANTKLAGIAANADVTLTAINGGLVITSGGLTLNGTPSIKSNNYVAGSAGWAIKGDGSVEFADGTFRGTIDVGSGDTRFYKPTSGAATYGNTSAGHIAMQNYAIGTASLRLNYGANTKVDIRAQPVGTDIVGTIYVFNADSSSFLQISGSAISGGGARLTWNGDTNLYRHTAGILKTDTDLQVVGGFTFRGCPLTQRVAKSHVLSTSGGAAEETFNIDISGYGFTAKPTAGMCQCASDKDYKARYDWDSGSNSSTNAVIKVSRFDGANTGAATLRFSLIFVQ